MEKIPQTITNRQANKKVNTILLVEDNNLILCTLKAMLKKLGFFVRAATTGHKALDLLNNVLVDLGLLNYNLPDTNGIQVLKTIKSKYPVSG